MNMEYIFKNMSYELFKKVVEEHGVNYLKGKYPDAKALVEKCYRINETKESICFVGDSMPNLRPVMYLDKLYADYKAGKPLEYILEGVGNVLNAAFYQNSNADIKTVAEQEFVNCMKKEDVTFFFVNTKQNKEYLSDKPHREFLDLSMVYHICLELDDGIGSLPLTYKHLSLMKVTEQELFDCVVDNMKRKDKPEIFYLSSFPGVPKEIAKALPIGILSNRSKHRGAASIFVEDVLNEHATNIGSNFYILPMDIHEVMLVPEHMLNLSDLENMLYTQNGLSIPIGERLSNNIYYYDRRERKVSIASTHGRESLDNEAYANVSELSCFEDFLEV